MADWFRVRNLAQAESGAREATLEIYDRIGEETDWWTGEKVGIAAAEFTAALRALGDVQQINLHINSPGGYVNDGWVIFNALRRHQARKHVFIDGQAASMASVIAMAGDQVTMGAGASLWVHNPLAVFVAAMEGNATDIRQAAEGALRLADGLDMHGRALRNVYVARSRGRLTEDAAQALMDAESLIMADQAVELGLADDIDENLVSTAAWDMSARLAAAVPAVQARCRGAVESAATADLAAQERAALMARVTELEALAPVPADAGAIIRAARAAQLPAEFAERALDMRLSARDLERTTAAVAAVRGMLAAAALPEGAQAALVAAVADAAMGHADVSAVLSAALQARLAEGQPHIASHLDAGGKPPAGEQNIRSIWDARARAKRRR